MQILILARNLNLIGGLYKSSLYILIQWSSFFFSWNSNDNDFRSVYWWFIECQYNERVVELLLLLYSTEYIIAPDAPWYEFLLRLSHWFIQKWCQTIMDNGNNWSASLSIAPFAFFGDSWHASHAFVINEWLCALPGHISEDHYPR